MRVLFNKEKIDGSYVYALLDPSTSEFVCGNLKLPHHPFYVGKGKDYRAWDHEKEKLTESCNKHKIYKIMNIKESFDTIPIAILEDRLTDDDSLLFEEYYAEIIGYDILTNINPCGVRNPVLFGDLNGFYGKSHTQETITRIVDNWKSWFYSLSDEEKNNYAKKRIEGWEKRRLEGYEYLPEWTESRLISRFGADYREKMNQRDQEKQQAKSKRKEIAEEKKKNKLAKGWAHLEGEGLAEYWKKNRGGENNGMFGNGHLLANENNGRAKKYIVTIGNDLFLIHGKLKHFQQSFKKFYKCSDPLRSQGFIEKYKVTVVEVDEFGSDGIVFVDENTFSALGYREYTKCKKSNPQEINKT